MESSLCGFYVVYKAQYLPDAGMAGVVIRFPILSCADDMTTNHHAGYPYSNLILIQRCSCICHPAQKLTIKTSVMALKEIGRARVSSMWWAYISVICDMTVLTGFVFYPRFY